MRSPGLSGLAVGLAAAGGVVMYAGLKNATISDVLRGVLKGQPPAGAPQNTKLAAALASPPAAAGGPDPGGTLGPASGDIPAGPLGASIAAAARRYLGKPYAWATAGPNTFDCSGLVTWVLHHDLGIELPSNSHTVTTQFLVWSGARTVGRPPAPGDLICWSGHIGIATSATMMIHAPTAGDVVKESGIWWIPAPAVRRVIG